MSWDPWPKTVNHVVGLKSFSPRYLPNRVSLFIGLERGLKPRDYVPAYGTVANLGEKCGLGVKPV